MGGLCSCCEDQSSETSPLLRGTQTKPVITTQQVPSYASGAPAAQQRQGVSAVPAAAAAGTSAPPESARKNRPDDSAKEKEFLTSLDHVTDISVQQLPAELPALNKTFQDHAKLYNELNGHFKDLRQALNDFKTKFLVETSGIPVLADCLRVLAERCGGAQLKAKREKHCIQLDYDRREVSEKCTGLPEDTLQALDLYNRINRLVKAIQERAPQVQRSLQIVLEDEHNLKKEVTKCDLPPDQGPDALRRCNENINQLRRLPGFIDTIQKYTSKIFKEIVEGSKSLLQAGDGDDAV